MKQSSVSQKSIQPSLPHPIGAEYDLEEVKALFNAKARTWNQKYEAGGSLAFRAVVFDSLIRRQLSTDARVLDLGCGTAAIASVLSESGFRVTACDIAEEMIEAGQKEIEQMARATHKLVRQVRTISRSTKKRV